MYVSIRAAGQVLSSTCCSNRCGVYIAAMNLILLSDADRTTDATFTLIDHRADHIRTVLKSQPGERLEVGMIGGDKAIAVVESIDVDSIVLSVTDWISSDPPDPAIDLICALPRPQTVKKLLFIAGMTGVRSLSFIRSTRVEKSFFHSPLLEPDNLRRHLLDGMSQGKSTLLPTVSIHDRFMQFWKEMVPAQFPRSESRVCIFAEPEHGESMLSIVTSTTRAIALALGPEGGWVDHEIDVMRTAGFAPCTLGRSILRVEHAAMAALAQIDLVRSTFK
jgi:RsmE family RNA methyltransferase